MKTFLFNSTTFALLDLGIFCSSCLLILRLGVWMEVSGLLTWVGAQGWLRLLLKTLLLCVGIVLRLFWMLFYCCLLWTPGGSPAFPSDRQLSGHTAQTGGSLEPCSDGWFYPICHRICGAQPSSGWTLSCNRTDWSDRQLWEESWLFGSSFISETTEAILFIGLQMLHDFKHVSHVLVV